MEQILASILLIALLLTLIVTLLVYPIVQVLELLNSKRPKKWLWVAGVGLTAPFGPFAYGLFHSDAKKRWTAGVLLTSSLVAVMLGLISAQQVVDESAKEIDRIRISMNSDQIGVLLPGEKDKLKNSLEILRYELVERHWFQPHRKVAAYALVDQLAEMLSDNNLSQSELQAWMSWFTRRREFSLPAWKRFVAEPRKITNIHELKLTDQSSVKKEDPFVQAIAAHDTGRAKELLGQGSDPNTKINNTPALAVAVTKGWIDLAKLLLDAGAEANSRVKGLTPLMLAVVREDAEMVSLLLRFGADVQATDKTRNTEGTSVLELARHGGNPEIIRLLKTEIERQKADGNPEKSVN